MLCAIHNSPPLADKITDQTDYFIFISHKNTSRSGKSLSHILFIKSGKRDWENEENEKGTGAKGGGKGGAEDMYVIRQVGRLVGNLTFQIRTKQRNPGSYGPSCANYMTLLIFFPLLF